MGAEIGVEDGEQELAAAVLDEVVDEHEALKGGVADDDGFAPFAVLELLFDG